jgi:hypothetical protein
LPAKLDDLINNPVYGAFTAVEHRADLHGGCFDDGHGKLPPDCFQWMARLRSCEGYASLKLNLLHHGVVDTSARRPFVREGPLNSARPHLFNRSETY